MTRKAYFYCKLEEFEKYRRITDGLNVFYDLTTKAPTKKSPSPTLRLSKDDAFLRLRPDFNPVMTSSKEINEFLEARLSFARDGISSLR